MEVILHVGGVCWVSTIGRVVNHVPEMLYGTSKKGKTFSHALTLFYRGETPAFNMSVLISTSKLGQIIPVSSPSSIGQRQRGQPCSQVPTLIYKRRTPEVVLDTTVPISSCCAMGQGQDIPKGKDLFPCPCIDLWDRGDSLVLISLH